MTKINPNPNCFTCINHQPLLIDGYGELVGFHDMCIRRIESKPIGNLIPLSPYYNDEQCIDGFLQGNGECLYYIENLAAKEL
jgi:hypothetical protein